MPSTFDFKNKVVIATGASSGVGLSTVQLLLASHATVFAVDRDPAPEALVSTSSKAPSSFYFHQADLTAPNTASEIVLACKEKFGPRIDALLNIAGIADDFTNADTVSDGMLAKVMEINVHALIRLMREVLPGMAKEGNGVIVNVSSRAGSTGAAAGTAYTASKHAVEGATKQTAFQFRDKGVRCNAVAPGAVKTNIMNDFSKINMEGMMTARPYLALNVSEEKPPMEPVEVANAIVFLASDLATHISGAILPVDGAWCAA